jgi:hypothetical protein
VQVQIAAVERRAIADRNEVEEVLAEDIDTLAEALAAIWKILDGLDESTQTEVEEPKLGAIKYGIGEITKENWLSTSRRMGHCLRMGSPPSIRRAIRRTGSTSSLPRRAPHRYP